MFVKWLVAERGRFVGEVDQCTTPDADNLVKLGLAVIVPFGTKSTPGDASIEQEIKTPKKEPKSKEEDKPKPKSKEEDKPKHDVFEQSTKAKSEADADKVLRRSDATVKRAGRG